MIANSLSKKFPQVQLEQGRMRAGLSVGGPEGRDRFWFQTKGEESFMSGEAYTDHTYKQNGWRRDFDFAVVDGEKNDLKVKVENGQLVIGNPGADLRVELGDVADKSLSDGCRLVMVESDVKGDKTRTRVSVGEYIDNVTTYEVRGGLLIQEA